MTPSINNDTETSAKDTELKDNERDVANKAPETQKKEIGGREGPEPTRYGDWENNGIASDF
ncbi:MAG: DUF1674 domain-containing protein [Kordiimonas sp.]|nr:DUF1674 domain-containing protein [Kordiimonas sp.]|tara:strand:- start:4549 stop:4731 length:183 start_codon:yes stop_codon:yes gene_type:complete